MALPTFQLMSRQACCLCDDAAAVLADFVAQGRCELEVLDVDQSPELAARYGMDVPVLMHQGSMCIQHRMTHEDMERILEALC